MSYFIVIVLALGFFMGGVALTDWLHERDRKRAIDRGDLIPLSEEDYRGLFLSKSDPKKQTSLRVIKGGKYYE